MDEVILVAVDASKEITDYALEWAVRNVVKATDILILLAVLPSRGRPQGGHNETYQSRIHRLLRKWGIGQNEKSSSAHTRFVNGVEHEAPRRINSICVQMMQQLCSAHNVMQVHTEVKVVAEARTGSVAGKAEELGANWVILDRRLKKESDCCLKQLDCNIVLIDHAIPKILRSINPLMVKKLDKGRLQKDPMAADIVLPIYNPYHSSATTRSSLGLDSPISDSDVLCSSSGSDKDHFHRTSPSTKFKLHLNSQYFHQELEAQANFSSIPSNGKSQPLNVVSRVDVTESPRRSSAGPLKDKTKSYSGPLKTRCDLTIGGSVKAKQKMAIPSRRSTDSPGFLQKPLSLNQSREPIVRRDTVVNNKSEASMSPSSPTIDQNSSIRRAMSLSIKQPPTPLPLCSVCKDNAPIFGQVPRKFSYKEIERATDGFSSKNFIAEGNYGPVYKGMLPDGQLIAVKQHKMLSTQGASEFCSEVGVLSCAQHRNLAMLVGYCTETEWLLVYEFACNGSLDKHLYGIETNEVMTWQNRMKVAIGAARALRYLHEDCRVGCIVHRDFRAANILLTHDFEPMVGDFGLASWQADGQSAEETLVNGAFGNIATEYTQTGLITEKADVHAFGIVLLELLTGVKAVEFLRNLGEEFLQELGHPRLERKIYNEMIDHRLENNYVKKEVECMMYAASLCISPHPEDRPRMSKVLKILEGDMPSDTTYHYRHPASSYPKQKVKNHHTNITEKQLNKTVDYSRSSNLMQVLHHMDSSPSSSSAHKNKRGSTLEPLMASDKHEMAKRGLGIEPI